MISIVVHLFAGTNSDSKISISLSMLYVMVKFKMIVVEKGLVGLFYIICLYSILVNGLDRTPIKQNVSNSNYTSRGSQSISGREYHHIRQQVNDVTKDDTRNYNITRMPSSDNNKRKQNATMSKRSQLANRSNGYDSPPSEPRQQQHQQQQDDSRIPFWNIAHMINSIEQVGIALR